MTPIFRGMKCISIVVTEDIPSASLFFVQSKTHKRHLQLLKHIKFRSRYWFDNKIVEKSTIKCQKIAEVPRCSIFMTNLSHLYFRISLSSSNCTSSIYLAPSTYSGAKYCIQALLSADIPYKCHESHETYFLPKCGLLRTSSCFLICSPKVRTQR